MCKDLASYLIVLIVATVFITGCRAGKSGDEKSGPGVGAASATVQLPTEDPDEEALHPMLADVIEAGPYQPKWASLVQHPMPDWFQNDKIGLSAHWGPYAVPGWTPRKDTPYGVAYAEWYMNWLTSGNKAVKEYHQKTYDGVSYDEFFDGTKNHTTGQIDGFLTKDFDADRWMRTFKAAGVKYFFLTAKHHDGFCLWDSQYTNRNAKQMGPKRDLLRELVDAARAHGLRIGFYYSYYEWYNPIYRDKPDLSGYKGIKPLKDEDGDGQRGEYVDDFMVPQIKELIDKYQPDYLCFDGEWEHGYVHWRSRQIMAYYYNQAAARGQEVIINDRFGQKTEGVSDTRGVYGDFYHVEYFANIDRAKPWAMWRGFGNSYGYNRNEHPSNILSIKDTVRMMVDVVADNGNVEFNLGPKADGTLASFETERLAAMGKWLKTNGSAIYGTTKSPVGILPNGRVTHRAETKTLYFHVYDWPEDGVLELPGIFNRIASARVLATGEAVKVKRLPEEGLRLEVPGAAPDPFVSVIELKYRGALKAERYVPKVKADAQGVFNLTAYDAVIHGKTLKLEEDKKALGFWTDRNDFPQWTIKVDGRGAYQLDLEYACDPAEAGGAYALVIDEERVEKDTFAIPSTGGWTRFQKQKCVKIELGKGTHTIAIRNLKETGPLMNVRSVVLRPVD